MINYLETIINERWKLVEHIGECSQGGVFIGRDLQVEEGQPDFLVAVKISLARHPKTSRQTSLVNEIMIYRSHLYPNGTERSAIRGIPKMIWSSTSLELSGQIHAVLVMTLLGYSLDHIRFYRCGGKLSLKSLLMVGMKLIDRLEALHTLGIVHCGMKPENVVVDPEDPISLPSEK